MNAEQRIAAHQDLTRAIKIAQDWLAEFWEAEYELSLNVDEPHVCKACDDAHALIELVEHK